MRDVFSGVSMPECWKVRGVQLPPTPVVFWKECGIDTKEKSCVFGECKRVRKNVKRKAIGRRRRKLRSRRFKVEAKKKDLTPQPGRGRHHHASWLRGRLAGAQRIVPEWELLVHTRQFS